MMLRRLCATGAVAVCALAGMSQVGAANAQAAWWDDWDPTYVIESPVNPQTAQGRFDSVLVTDAADGDHEIPVLIHVNRGKGPYYARVQAEASGYTPGAKYTVRITARSAGSGDNWGVYTWQRYTATQDGKLHIDLRLYIPSKRAHVGEQIVAAPAVYKAEDIRQDGRPEKVDKKCVLKCERVAPVTRFEDYTSPDAMITFGPAE
ncbi:hypothetical protein H8R18_07420 [Nanchangia anserum]|uniref:Secreted protein n=1 Tax=Nanchangia anserum TaxID=2692125 RepID=A0A8I0G8Z5_9ACTO|nr:hypothetical protein [Nanchangia anserum]MBD3689354.1 hypothetical protein [Nanchangia anserum]QOX81560.1 hypothetical protein H8R18_07420 [Nanchangia anserum]